MKTKEVSFVKYGFKNSQRILSSNYLKFRVISSATMRYMQLSYDVFLFV